MNYGWRVPSSLAALLAAATLLALGCGGDDQTQRAGPTEATPPTETIPASPPPQVTRDRSALRRRGCGIRVTGDYEFVPVHVRGVSCRRAAHVLLRFQVRLRRLSKAVDGPDCDATLCTRPAPVILGYRCRGKRVGDADWTLTCRDGQQSIKTSSAF